MDADVLIIGGGPSGLSTALHLQRIAPQLAPRILILEKARYPRLKLCAGGLVPDAETMLERLGLDVSDVPHVDVEDVHFDFEGRGLKIRMPERHTLRVIRRDEFDAWLAAKVKERGIQIREGITVRNVVTGTEGVTVETDHGIYHSRVVVGADGSNGITRRCIFPGSPPSTARVLEVITPSHRFKKSTGMEQKQGRGPAAYFDFFPVPNNIAGYVWDFPAQVRGEPVRCWGIYDTNILAAQRRPHLKDLLSREMSRLGFDLNDYEIKGHPIRWFSPGNRMAAPRVILVGDAAGADPLFGEGISIALAYGAVAARVICAAIQRNDFSFQDYRRRVLFSLLGQTLLMRWLSTYTVYLMKWRWFQILVWRVMKPIAMVAARTFVLNWARRIR